MISQVFFSDVFSLLLPYFGIIKYSLYNNFHSNYHQSIPKGAVSLLALAPSHYHGVHEVHH